MAKPKNPPYSPPQPPEDELTVTVFRFRGSSESMQKGFEAFGAALGAALGTAAPPQRQVNGNARKAQAALPVAHPDTLEPDSVDTVDEDDELEATADATTSATPKAKKARIPYTFMDDFNLAPEGKTSWQDYVKAHGSPEGVEERFMLASSWAQTHGGADPFTGGHLFTLFRAQKWPTQADMTQPLRKMKSRKSYYDNPEFGKWKMTGIGLADAEKITKA
jgi:hypothetical protein